MEKCECEIVSTEQLRKVNVTTPEESAEMCQQCVNVTTIEEVPEISVREELGNSQVLS
jgi:hypothetical protein